MDTTNEFYDTENNFMDEVKPVYEGLIYKYYKSLIDAKYRKFLERKYGKQLFRIAELKLRTFSPEIVEDLQAENQLVSQHTKLIASAKFMFDGKERTLSQMLALGQSPDRETRRKIREIIHNEYNLPHETEFDEIFDKLVTVRHQIARKLGFTSFIELAYARLGRTEYDSFLLGHGCPDFMGQMPRNINLLM
jgi:oligoendopeptidase F